MIIVRILGGLGNQMFQYAAGRSLALRHGAPLKLDLRWMRRYSLHRLLLTQLPVLKDEPDWIERWAHTGFPFQRHPPYPLFRLLSRVWPRVHMERSLAFDERFNRLGPDHFLFGYFQSPRYFAGHEDAIREDFQYPLNPDRFDKAILDRAMDPDAVAVQFRRGDYVTDRSNCENIGICPAEYYLRAARFARERIGAPRLRCRSAPASASDCSREFSSVRSRPSASPRSFRN